jgi:hypothetical protein
MFSGHSLATATAVGLPPYTGPFDRERAGHLLRRTLYGPKLDEIDSAVRRGLTATLDILFAPASAPSPPLNHKFEHDGNVPIGSTWVNSPNLDYTNVEPYRSESMRSWFWNNQINSGTHISEKLLVFWMNHFGLLDPYDHRSMYGYIELLRRYSLGNFRDLIKEVTIAPAMLEFLNGRYNYKDAPDENYARELIELFTVQKGRAGDVNYTEQDVREIARILTGWRVHNFWSNNHEPPEPYFEPTWHDTGTKQLSAHFGHAVIENAGADEYRQLIDVIFQHREAPKAICRDLYIYFVDQNIDDRVENEVIEPLSRLLMAHDFEIRPVLYNLLASDHFLRDAHRGVIIKNPHDILASMVRPLHGYGHLNLSLRQDYLLAYEHYRMAKQMDMDIMEPPSVSGWKAYYQRPAFYRSWISSTTLQQRRRAVQEVCGKGVWGDDGHKPLDWLGYLNGLPTPDDVNAVLEDTIAVFLPRPAHPDQISSLKEILLPGLPDFEWTIEYRRYREQPDDPERSVPLTTKLRDFFRALFSMAEFHLQ